VRRRREDVVRLARADHALVRGVRPRHDGLRAQRFFRKLVAGFGAQDARQIVLERQLVHDGDAVADPNEIERRWIVAAVDAERTIAGEPEPWRPHAVDVDERPRRHRADRIHA
jgi:hypothetical protein